MWKGLCQVVINELLEDFKVSFNSESCIGISFLLCLLLLLLLLLQMQVLMIIQQPKIYINICIKIDDLLIMMGQKIII